MSHAWGEVIHEGKVVGRYEYNGTADVAMSRIFDTNDELKQHWRTEHADDAECTCGQPPADVILYSDYGGGFHWPAKACLKCHAIVEHLRPWSDYEDEWPKDGEPSTPTHKAE